jgi:peptidoglycan hydrolase CwlO-like protein
MTDHQARNWISQLKEDLESLMDKVKKLEKEVEELKTITPTLNLTMI